MLLCTPIKCTTGTIIRNSIPPVRLRPTNTRQQNSNYANAEYNRWQKQRFVPHPTSPEKSQSYAAHNQFQPNLNLAPAYCYANKWLASILVGAANTTYFYSGQCNSVQPIPDDIIHSNAVDGRSKIHSQPHRSRNNPNPTPHRINPNQGWDITPRNKVWPKSKSSPIQTQHCDARHQFNHVALNPLPTPIMDYPTVGICHPPT